MEDGRGNINEEINLLVHINNHNDRTILEKTEGANKC